MEIIIRPGNQADFPAILELAREFAVFQRTPHKLHITLEQMNLDKDIFNCYVAETHDKLIVGVASYFFSYYSWTGKGLYLDDLYVSEGYRKLSIGKRLLDTVIARAKAEKCHRMRWLVSRWNSNAIEFYKSIGATVDDTDWNCELDLTTN